MNAGRHGALVIFGSGPGIGAHVASRFARGGFQKVVLLSRNATRLSDDAFVVYSNAPQVQVNTVATDLTDSADLQRALRKVEDVLEGTPIECVHYNAARVEETWLLGESAEDLRKNLEVSVVSLYTVAQWAIPRLLAVACIEPYKPALLVTSGWLANEPEVNYFALGVCKAAQQHVIHTLSNQLRPMGVHCALVMVNGRVREDATATNPTNIAERSWELYSLQGHGGMEVETHIGRSDVHEGDEIDLSALRESFGH